MALLRSPRTDDPFQLSFGLSRYRQCCAACPHATQHSRSDAILKLCMRHYTSLPYAGVPIPASAGKDSELEQIVAKQGVAVAGPHQTAALEGRRQPVGHLGDGTPGQPLGDHEAVAANLFDGL